MRYAALFILFAVAVGPTGATAQGADDLARFFGVWEGTAVAENPRSEFFPVSARDFDVTVRPADGGFTVTWGATIRGRDEPFSAATRRREATLHFRETESDGVYLARDPADPAQGSDISWARLEGNTLTVTELVRSDAGSYDTLVTERTLTAYGLELHFERFRDGEIILSAHGRAARVAD